MDFDHRNATPTTATMTAAIEMPRDAQRMCSAPTGRSAHGECQHHGGEQQARHRDARHPGDRAAPPGFFAGEHRRRKQRSVGGHGKAHQQDEPESDQRRSPGARPARERRLGEACKPVDDEPEHDMQTERGGEEGCDLPAQRRAEGALDAERRGDPVVDDDEFDFARDPPQAGRKEGDARAPGRAGRPDLRVRASATRCIGDRWREAGTKKARPLLPGASLGPARSPDHRHLRLRTAEACCGRKPACACRSGRSYPHRRSCRHRRRRRSRRTC